MNIRLSEEFPNSAVECSPERISPPKIISPRYSSFGPIESQNQQHSNDDVDQEDRDPETIKKPGSGIDLNENAWPKIPGNWSSASVHYLSVHKTSQKDISEPKSWALPKMVNAGVSRAAVSAWKRRFGDDKGNSVK